MYYPPVENSPWRLILARLEKIGSEKIVYALLFLFPIFAVTVRHWVSNIFVVLSLISLSLLYSHRKQRSELLKEEKILLWGFAAYFGVFVLTSIINGWGELQTRYMGVEIRFLLFVPLYLAVRNMNGAAKYLILGTGLGVVYTAFNCVWKTVVNNVDVYTGVYSQLFTGPIILILTFLFVPYAFAKTNNLWGKLFLSLIVLMGLYVVTRTGARNAYLAAVVLYVLFAIHQLKGVARAMVIGVAMIVAYGAYLSDSTINTRIDRAVAEYKEYFAYENPAKFTGSLTSVGTRLEMWRVTPIFFSDNPLFGVSRGNYSAEVVKYINKGLVHPDIGHHGHPHNVYSEAIISKGLFGFISLLFITVYPLFILIKGYRDGVTTSIYGITLIVGYMVVSLTDASTLIKGNYSSMYIIFLAVLFSYYIQEKQQI